MSSAPGLAEDQPILLDLMNAALARTADGKWQLDAGDFWCRVIPDGYSFRPQGWKIHVSATPLSAPFVLARCASVLLRHRCAFKFAADLSNTQALVDRDCPRGSGGKFITAYPACDDQFRLLTAELDRATADLHGPKILSDRQLRLGSLVHYRYGAYDAESVLTNDGTFVSVLVAPDGTVVADQRRAWFSPPPWAGSPFPDAPAAPARAAEAVLLDGRFAVHRAIRHSNKGGVYVARDTQTQKEVIIKQARQHTAASLDGADSRDYLRHEAEMLDTFAPLGISPRKLALFEQQGDLFLAEDLIPGARLEQWVTSRAGQQAGWPLSLTTATSLATRLVDVLAAAHRTGLVLRDFTPNNLMVTPEEEIRLIDLEFAVRPGAYVARCWTMAFAAPEQVAAPRVGPAPSQEADLFSLGATLFYLLSGTPPQDRLSELISLMAADNAALAALAPLIRGLMDEVPEHRWTVHRAREFLLDRDRPKTRTSTPPAPDLDGLVRDGLTFVRQAMTPGLPRLWASADHGNTTDPCNVQHGAAGVLAVLVRAAQLGGPPWLRDTVRTAAGWIDERLDAVPRILPGLYFGRSGTAWALHDAAGYLGDQQLAARAVLFAQRVPIDDWGNPDITHGLAGAGLAHIHLWQATGQADLWQRAARCAEAVQAAARRRGSQTLWPIPAGFDSSLAGLEHYGFAHGVAGVGAFLLYAGVAGQQESYLTAALTAGRTLSQAARLEGDGAWWPADAAPATEHDGPGPAFQHWCSGASGVGTFLIRLWHVTGDQHFLDLAGRAAVTVRRQRWQAGNSACCGLAGDGEFLLDMAQFTGQEKYTQWAHEIAAVIYARRLYRDGLCLASGQRPAVVTADFNTGLGGILGFLLRLRHRAPRWWMADALLPPR
jgi:tRNA A-37 threonylcarbamoyl transferase component Bud32